MKHVLCFVAAAALAATAPEASGGAAGAPGGEQTLDYAFRFATAVEDVQDRAKAQESAIQAYVELGLLDAAERRAAEIDGWRRGAVLGRLAAVHARAGRADRALELVATAESVGAQARDWGRDRVLAQVAEVRALLGATERAREIAGRLIADDPRTYEGRAVVVLAWAEAATGNLDGAARTLSTLDASVDIYVTWWRTEGYLDLAGRSDLDPGDRARLLDKARESSAGIDGWKQAEMLGKIAERLALEGRREDAVETLEAAQRILLSQPDTMSLRGPLLADLALAWSRIGEQDRALEAAAAARAALDRVSSVVELPASIARVAAAYSALGRQEESRRLLASAIDHSLALENARPRALALSAVCREAGRRGIALDERERARLDAPLAGL